MVKTNRQLKGETMVDHTHEEYDAAINRIDKTLSDSKKRHATFEETNRREHQELRNKIDGVRDAVDENYKLLNAKIGNEINKVNSNIDKVEAKIESEIDKVNGRIDRVEARIDKVEAKIDKVNDKIDKVLEYMTRLIFDQRQQEANRQANRVEQEANRLLNMKGIIWTLIVMSTLGVVGHIISFFVR